MLTCTKLKFSLEMLFVCFCNISSFELSMTVKHDLGFSIYWIVHCCINMHGWVSHIRDTKHLIECEASVLIDISNSCHLTEAMCSLDTKLLKGLPYASPKSC